MHRWLLVAFACSGTPTPAPRSAPEKPEAITSEREVIDAGAPPSEPVIDPVLRDRGAQLFQDKGCVACHSLDGTFRIGPSLLGAWGTTVPLVDGTSVVFEEAYVRESIMNAQAKQRAGFVPVMPQFDDRITPDELDAIVVFIHSLHGMPRPPR